MADSDCNIVFVPHPTDKRFIDQTAKVFGRLTVLGFAGKIGRSNHWFCLCKCGTVKTIASGNLQNGKTNSCGCLVREFNIANSRTHGRARTTEYTSYALAKDRCNNHAHSRYASYGGRGIQFRFNSFEEFFALLGLKPDATYSLDRIDVNGHYEPSNVRWATDHEQNTNTRKTIYATIDGITKSLVDWTGFKNKDYWWARKLIRKQGIAPNEAIAMVLARRAG